MYIEDGSVNWKAKSIRQISYIYMHGVIRSATECGWSKGQCNELRAPVIINIPSN